MTARAILFDFNGVIVNDEPQHCDALIATLCEYGYRLDRDTYYRDYLGFDDRECFRYAFGLMGRPLDDATLREAIERKAVLYQESIRRNLELVPGVADFVRAAAAGGLRLAVVSGALRREIDLVLGISGLRHLFERVVAAEDVSSCKPDPQGYESARRALGLEPSLCVVVEDSLPGLAAARAAGLSCAMVATSHPVEALHEADCVWPDFIGRSPAELPWQHG